MSNNRPPSLGTDPSDPVGGNHLGPQQRALPGHQVLGIALLLEQKKSFKIWRHRLVADSPSVCVNCTDHTKHVDQRRQPDSVGTGQTPLRTFGVGRRTLLFALTSGMFGPRTIQARPARRVLIR
jgi:hypothetical protein